MRSFSAFIGTIVIAIAGGVAAAAPGAQPAAATVRLADVRMRDACILPVAATKTYYLVASAFGAAVRAYTSKDLVTWEGPQIIFQAPNGFWGGAHIRSIWAPELHAYVGKYYLFLTFDTADKFPEQWRNWLPRVTRGSQVLWADAPLGPYHAFADHATLPADMMTLDGTLWVEDGLPYMVFCHEWVQIVDGTVEMIRLTDDLSATMGEPTRLFFGSDAPWSKQSQQYGCWVTDGPYLYRSTSGKLFMIWSSGGATGYACGVAVSESGKLAGPWVQRPEPLFANDGGHGMIFRTFEGKLMLALHQPNVAPKERIHLFELEDTGDTLRIAREFGGPP
ncbi:MAG TPA: glycoside hydrolase family 43 protein [Opitutaceae bacterium]|nr:glycoside hydrolase family 43 protein [Opitutaceae bacterium]